MKALKEEVSIYWLYWYKSVCGLELLVYAVVSSDEGAQGGGTQFTGFTGTKSTNTDAAGAAAQQDAEGADGREGQAPDDVAAQVTEGHLRPHTLAA